MIKTIFAILFFLLNGCTTPAKKTMPNLSAAATRAFLFPHGQYQHDVRVHLIRAPEHGPQDFNFQGIYVWDNKIIKLVGVSPFGVTLFRLTEQRENGKIESEIYMPGMARFQDKIIESYKLMRTLLTARVGESLGPGITVLERTSSGDLPTRVRSTEKGNEFDLKLSEYDNNKIPRTLHIESPRYEIHVEVISYEI